MAENKTKKKNRRPQIVLGILLGILAVLIMVVILLLTHTRPDPWKGQESGVDSTTEEEEENDGETVDPNAPTMDSSAAQESLAPVENQQPVKDEGWSHYLLLGIDSTTNKGRSDVMVILSVNQDEKRVVLSSVPRDTYVYIEGSGFNKLAHAYSAGGAQLTMETYENNFDIDIENYFAVNFETLPEIVDLIGGVTLTLTDAEAQHMEEWYGAWGVKGGTQILNGKEVLAYCRVRKIDSDYKRNERQYKALMAIYEKVKDLPVDDYVALAKTAYNSVYSDMTVGGMLLLLKDVMTIAGESGIEHICLVDSAHSTTPNLKSSSGTLASYVVVNDLEEIVTQWRENLGVEGYTPSERVQQISAQLDKIMGR